MNNDLIILAAGIAFVIAVSSIVLHFGSTYF